MAIRWNTMRELGILAAVYVSVASVTVIVVMVSRLR